MPESVVSKSSRMYTSAETFDFVRINWFFKIKVASFLKWHLKNKSPKVENCLSFQKIEKEAKFKFFLQKFLKKLELRF